MANAGAIAVEMENSTLFTIASLRGIRAASCAVVDGSPLKWDEKNYDPHGGKVHGGKDAMFTIGLEAIRVLAADL